MESDLLLPAIKALISEMVTELAATDQEVPVETYLEMGKNSPVVGPALQVIALLTCLNFGSYTHPDQDAQELVQRNFENMRGSLTLSVEEQSSAFALGNAVSQWGVEMRDGERALIDIQILEPTMIKFEGKRGAISSVVFDDGVAKTRIPYSGEEGRIIHTFNGRHLAFRDPRGVAALRRAKAPWEAWKILMGETLIAGQRQATPIVVGYSDSAALVPMLDATGAPLRDANNDPVMVPAPKAMLDELTGLSNRSVLSTDLKNRIEALKQETNGAFLLEGIRLCQQLQMMSLIFPETLLLNSGAGDSNLAGNQRLTISLLIEALANTIKEGLLENPVRWLLTWNRGPQESFGSFPPPPQQDEDRVALLGALASAANNGLFSAADIDVINRARELAGLSLVETAPTREEMSRSLENLHYWR